jgi:signal recognition particle receptor subunit beta
MIIGTAGHIDHGKTALVRALTGVDTDRLPEEKARGITIDLGYAYQPLESGEILGFVDVPGHERLVHTMVAGATGIDFVLLVVAADDGPMPQTREHVQVLDLLGLAHGAVALTKIDRVPAERAREAAAGIRQLLAGTGLAESPIFPVCADSRIVSLVPSSIAEILPRGSPGPTPFAPPRIGHAAGDASPAFPEPVVQFRCGIRPSHASPAHLPGVPTFLLVVRADPAARGQEGHHAPAGPVDRGRLAAGIQAVPARRSKRAAGL